MNSKPTLKLLLSAVVCCVGIKPTAAQTLINFDSCYAFVQSTWSKLNQDVYSGVSKGKLIPYNNDSLASAKQIQEIHYTEIVRQVQNPSNPNDPYDVIDSMVRIPFNPTTDFVGSMLMYIREVNANSGSTSFSLWSYAPLKNLRIANADLGNVPHFHISLSELFGTIPSEDVKFYKGFFSQRTLQGDLSNPNRDVKKDKSGIAYDGICTSLYGGHYSQNCVPASDSVMGYYELQLFTAMATKQWENNAPLYKEKDLLKPYDNWISDLATQFVVQIQNPENPDVPDFIDTTLFIPFAFKPSYSFEIWKRKDDYIVGLIVKDTNTQKGGKIYYSFNQLSKYLLPTDKVVLERLLKHFAG